MKKSCLNPSIFLSALWFLFSFALPTMADAGLSCRAKWFHSYCGTNVMTAALALTKEGDDATAEKILDQWDKIMKQAEIPAGTEYDPVVMKQALQDYGLETVKSCLGRVDGGFKQIMTRATACD